MNVSEIKGVRAKAKKKLAWIITPFLIFILVYLLYGNTGFKNVKMVGFENKYKKENPNPLRKNKVVITSIHMGAGHNDSLGLVMASPYKNVEQASQLYRYSALIKDDFLMSVSEEKLKRWIKNRDFDDIKTTFRNTVNKFLDEPVAEVYISSYFYE